MTFNYWRRISSHSLFLWVEVKVFRNRFFLFDKTIFQKRAKWHWRQKFQIVTPLSSQCGLIVLSIPNWFALLSLSPINASKSLTHTYIDMQTKKNTFFFNFLFFKFYTIEILTVLSSSSKFDLRLDNRCSVWISLIAWRQAYILQRVFSFSFLTSGRSRWSGSENFPTCLSWDNFLELFQINLESQTYK